MLKFEVVVSQRLSQHVPSTTLCTRSLLKSLTLIVGLSPVLSVTKIWYFVVLFLFGFYNLALQEIQEFSVDCVINLCMQKAHESIQFELYIIPLKYFLLMLVLLLFIFYWPRLVLNLNIVNLIIFLISNLDFPMADLQFLCFSFGWEVKATHEFSTISVKLFEL